MFGLFKSRKPLELDIFASNPFAREGFEALLSNDNAKLVELYKRQHASDRYSWILTITSNAPDDFDFPYHAEAPELLTIFGALMISKASKARGYGVASTVSDDAVRDMFSYAQSAYDALEVAATLAPKDSVPIAFNIRAAILASDNSNHVFELVEHLHQTTEPTLFAPVNYLIHQQEKWMGSHEKMWQIANHYAATGPNPCWKALIAFAKIEEWLWFAAFEDDRDLKKAYSDRRFSQEFKDEIATLDAEFWSALKAFDGEIPESEKRFAHDYFGGLSFKLGDKALARPHMEAIGPHISELPWIYMSAGSKDLMKNWNNLRKQVGLEGFYADSNDG